MDVKPEREPGSDLARAYAAHNLMARAAEYRRKSELRFDAANNYLQYPSIECFTLASGELTLGCAYWLVESALRARAHLIYAFDEPQIS